MLRTLPPDFGQLRPAFVMQPDAMVALLNIGAMLIPEGGADDPRRSRQGALIGISKQHSHRGGLSHRQRRACTRHKAPLFFGRLVRSPVLAFLVSSENGENGDPPGQVCHFEAPSRWANSNSRLDAEAALRRLRLTLPKAILPLELGLAPSGFHSRLTAKKKQYSYRLSTTSLVMPFDARRCWLCGDLDLEAVQKAIEALSGREMDYSAFSTGENDPDYHGSNVKSVDLSMHVKGPDQIFIFAVSERFLYKMVRRIVGGLVEVGKGRLEASSLELANRRQIPTAPPEGLQLDEVIYPFDLNCKANERV